MKLRTAVVGASGYAGMELTRLLQRHPRIGAPVLFRREGGRGSGEVGIPTWGGIGSGPIDMFSVEGLKEKGVALLFLATPHEFSRSIVPQVLEQGIRVIDLSGAWRLREAENRAVYGFDDPDVKAANEVMGRADL